MTNTPSRDDEGNRDERQPPAGDRSAPFGLPVLAEVPELAGVLERLREMDGLLAVVVEGLITLQDHHLAETITGVALEQWLAAVGRRTSADRRMLATAAAVCRRLPSLRAAFSQGTVSWAQVRAVVLRVERLPGHLDDRIDAELAAGIAGTDGADPDELARVVSWTLASMEADTGDARETSAPEQDWLAMQPRLDGSGGELHGDFGAAGFAVLDAALNEGLPAPDGPVKDEIAGDADRGRSRRIGAAAARHRARRLLWLCGARDGAAGDGSEVGASSDPDGRSECHADGDAEVGGGGPSGLRPRLVARAELSTLLGRDGLPADLLTRLTGGVLHVDADTARQLMDAHGTDLRLVLVDHGRVVGVGRTSRQPPGWLAEVATALRDTCSEPGCRTPARHCDVDHARPWSRRGRTDIDNLAPVCATANHRKESGGWRVHQHPDGTRIWWHERSGVSTRTLPARWRPPAVSAPTEGRSPPAPG